MHKTILFDGGIGQELVKEIVQKMIDYGHQKF